MKNQHLHKRLSLQTVTQVIRQFQENKFSIKMACDLLGVSKSRLYQLKEKWGAVPATELMRRSLYERETPLLMAQDAQDFLRQEIRFMKNESKVMQGHFNFALLAHMAPDPLFRDPEPEPAGLEPAGVPVRRSVEVRPFVH